MNGIPVLIAEGQSIAEAWENSLIHLYESGCDIKTQYDKPGDPPSKDATMMVTVHNPLAEPMIHKDFPGGFEDLQEYVMEVCEGIKDHCVRDPDDESDTRWEYTYHQRLFAYAAPAQDPFDQVEHIAEHLDRQISAKLVGNTELLREYGERFAKIDRIVERRRLRNLIAGTGQEVLRKRIVGSRCQT